MGEEERGTETGRKGKKVERRYFELQILLFTLVPLQVHVYMYNRKNFLLTA